MNDEKVNGNGKQSEYAHLPRVVKQERRRDKHYQNINERIDVLVVFQKK